MSHNSHIADHVIETAARRLDDPDPEVRSMAGEIMRLAQNRPPLGLLGQYAASLPRTGALSDPRLGSILEGYSAPANPLLSLFEKDSAPPAGAHAK